MWLRHNQYLMLLEPKYFLLLNHHFIKRLTGNPVKHVKKRDKGAGLIALAPAWPSPPPPPSPTHNPSQKIHTRPPPFRSILQSQQSQCTESAGTVTSFSSSVEPAAVALLLPYGADTSCGRWGTWSLAPPLKQLTDGWEVIMTMNISQWNSLINCVCM